MNADVAIPHYQARVLFLYWDASSEICAGLLTAELQKQMGDKLAAIRQEAYESGFKDAKAKRKKQTDFWRGW